VAARHRRAAPDVDERERRVTRTHLAPHHLDLVRDDPGHRGLDVEDLELGLVSGRVDRDATEVGLLAATLGVEGRDVENEFELVMGLFEKVTHEKTEFLHHVSNCTFSLLI